MRTGKIPYPYWIIVSCCALMTSCIAIPLSCASLFFPEVCKELQVGTGSLAVYMTLQNVVMALGLPVASKILTTKDVRVVFTGAIVLYAVTFASMGMYTNLTQFYIAGMLLGVAGAFTVYLSVPLLVNAWFKTKAGTAMGVAYAFIGIGAVVLSPVTGYVITHFGWRTAYVVLGVIIAVVSLPFTLFVIRGKPSDVGQKAYGEDEALAAAGTAAHTGTNGAEDGLSRAEALKTPQFWMTFAFAGILGITAAFMYNIASYIATLDFEPSQASTIAATVLSLSMVGVTLAKVGVGCLIDKIGILYAGPFAIVLGIAGVMILWLFGNLGLGVLIVGAVLYGVAYASTVLLPPHVVKTIFGNREYAGIYSSVMVCSALGTAFGTSLLGFIKDATGTYIASLLVVLVLLLLATIMLIAALVSGRKLRA